MGWLRVSRTRGVSHSALEGVAAAHAKDPFGYFWGVEVGVLVVLGRPVGVDAVEHAGGLADLDDVSVGIA
jgi:hypothetical protein